MSENIKSKLIYIQGTLSGMEKFIKQYSECKEDRKNTTELLRTIIAELDEIIRNVKW